MERQDAGESERKSMVQAERTQLQHRVESIRRGGSRRGVTADDNELALVGELRRDPSQGALGLEVSAEGREGRQPASRLEHYGRVRSRSRMPAAGVDSDQKNTRLSAAVGEKYPL